MTDGVSDEVRQLTKLIEAALTTKIRMHLTTGARFQEDVVRASIMWSEAVRMKFPVVADTSLDMTEKLLVVHGLDWGSATKLEKSLAITSVCGVPHGTRKGAKVASGSCNSA